MVVREKNRVFFVDGVGRFLGRSFNYELPKRIIPQLVIIREGKRKREWWARLWVMSNLLPVSFPHRKKTLFQLPESTPKKCVTLAGEADSARFTLSVGKMAHGRCQLTEIYSGDSTCIYMGKLNTLILVRKLYSKLRNAEESMSVLCYPGPRFGSHL